MNAASFAPVTHSTAPVSQGVPADWEEVIAVFHGNFYQLQRQFQSDSLKPAKAKELKKLQQLMMMALVELNDDLDSPLPAARVLARHAEIISGVNNRVAGVLAQL